MTKEEKKKEKEIILPSKPHLPGKASKRPSSTVPKRIIRYPTPWFKSEDLDNKDRFPVDEDGRYILPTYCRWCFLYYSCWIPLPEGFSGLCKACLHNWLKIGAKKSMLPKAERNYLRREEYQRRKESGGKRFCEDCGKEISKGKSLCEDCAFWREHARTINRGLKEGSIEGLTEDAGKNITRVGGGSTQEFRKHQLGLRVFDKLIERAEAKQDFKEVKRLKIQKKKLINKYKSEDVKLGTVKSGQELDSFEYNHFKSGIRESKKDRSKDDDEQMEYDDVDDVDK